MYDQYHVNQYILCPQCDMMAFLPKLPDGHKAICPRCHTILTIKYNDITRQYFTIYGVMALFMLLLSSIFPFIYMKVGGITIQIKLLEIPGVMFSKNYTILGIFILLFVQIIPAFCLLTILLVINLSKISIKLKILLACIFFQLKNWGMAEIFLAGILVSFIKLMAYGDVGVGSSFLPWCLYCVLQLRTLHCFDRKWVWDNISPPPIPSSHQRINIGIPGIQQGLRSCSCCTAILSSSQKICPRCGMKGYIRRKNSLQWTISLSITSVMLYIPANILPIMITDLFGKKIPSSILSGISLLWREGSYLIAGVILITSIIVPSLKIIAIIWLCLDAKGNGQRDSDCIYIYFIYEVVEVIGRWSMIEVFVIAILSALVRIDGLINIYPEIGVIMFTLVVILTMFAAMTFDPRLSWDREPKIKL